MSNTVTPAGQYLPINGTDIYYERYGEAGPPLLLIHGGTMTLESWEPQKAAFSQHFQVIAFDSRGHGRTRNPADRLSYRMQADDTAALIQALKLDRPLVCGYSDGGQIGLELAIRYPQLAGAYVIGAASPHWSEAYYSAMAGLGMLGEGQVDLALAETNHPDFVTHMKTHDAFQGQGYWKTFFRQLSMLWLEPLPFTAADFQQIREPVLLIAGDRDELILPAEQAVELHRQIPQSELALVPGVGHGLPWERPELFGAIIVDFLLRHATTQAV